MDRYNIFNYSTNEIILILLSSCGLLVLLLIMRIKIENLFSEPSQRKEPELITKKEKQLINKYRKLNSEEQEKLLEYLSNFYNL